MEIYNINELLSLFKLANSYKEKCLKFFMRGVFIIMDGIGDLPNKSLKNKTPLEAAKTPNLDFFASHGKLGHMHPVKPKFVPASDEAIVSIFGNKLISSSRGQLEAKGVDLNLTRGDLALRVNFGTIDNLKSKKVIDRRAGRTLTTKEAQELAKAINQIELPCPFIFEPNVQHRAVLVLKGGFSDIISENDLTYSRGKIKTIKRAVNFKPLNNKDLSHYTVNILNEFIQKSFEVLDKHPVNKKRRKKGLLPANYLFMRGQGIEIPKLKQYKKWISFGYMPLEIGFSKLSGMQVISFNYPQLKGLDAYKNLWKGLRKICKFSIKNLKRYSKKFDYAYIHIKETDLPGHDNKPLEKKAMIEYIDKTLFKFLRKFSLNGLKILVTGDHSTPCVLKTHSADPVPVLLYNHSPLDKKRFCEKDAKKGILGEIMGNDLFKVVGFNR